MANFPWNFDHFEDFFFLFLCFIFFYTDFPISQELLQLDWNFLWELSRATREKKEKKLLSRVTFLPHTKFQPSRFKDVEDIAWFE